MKSLLYEKTCCGIVLYNPDISLLKKNIDALINQVAEIILINNNSTNIKEIEELINEYDNKISIINNKQNLGIATALNEILDYASNNNYEWYLTMDQDSIVSTNMIQEYSNYIQINDIGIICPFVLNNNKITIEEYNFLSLNDIDNVIEPIECITSGSLNKTVISKKIGGYCDQMFIDSVDVDFNIRIIKHGFKIIRVNSVYLIQEMGKGKVVGLFSFLYSLTHIKVFKKLSVSPVYSDLRLYYIFRNSKYLYSKYKDKAGKKMSDKWMLGQAAYYCLTYPINRSRIKMLKNIFKGRKDSIKLGEFFK